MKNDRFIHHNSNVGSSNYHFIFRIKYRRYVFYNEKIKKYTEAVIRKKTYEMGLKIKAIGFGPDHVHLYVSNCEKFSVPKMINRIKGFSSMLIRKEMSKELIPYNLGKSFWAQGYFYESIGGATEEQIMNYIIEGQKKHWDSMKINDRIYISQNQKTDKSP